MQVLGRRPGLLMAPTSPSSQPSPLSDQVVNWLLLLRSGRATQRDYADFMAWRQANPQHDSAWQQLAVTLGGGAFGRLGDTYPEGYEFTPPAAQQAPAHAAPVSPARRRFLAGATLLAAGGASAAYIGNFYYPLGGLAADATTGTAERRRYKLSDGSELLLDARSEVDLTFTPGMRLLKLRAGAVMVAASAYDDRQFVVETAEGIVRSAGNRYMVRQLPHRTLVVAHEDPVAIETRAGMHNVLAPGMGVRFDAVRVGAARADLAAAAAWENGIIDARGQPLADVVDILRPYYRGVLRVSMAAGGLPVSGRFPLDDVSATLRSLEAGMPITVRRYTPWFISIDVSSA